MDLGRTGIWSGELRFGERGAVREAAAELERLGYGTLWIPGGIGGAVFAESRDLLDATEHTVVATGILNLWMHEASETAAQFHSLTAEHGDRFLVGIGISHAPLIDAGEAGRYRRPLARTREYLDALDAADQPLPTDRRVLAALGPKMLELARTRTAGTHPYLVTPEHTAIAREALGDGPLVAPEQAVVLETDPDRARAIARTHLSMYLGLPNYSNNWKRIGFTDDDLADGGSDRLVDALVVWGDEEAIARRVAEHRAAGADHVCLQVLTAEVMGFAADECRRLAPAVV